MCYRVVERYAVCRCVYFVHGVDQCAAYGRAGHPIEDRDLLVGHTCPQHSGASYASSSSYSPQTSPFQTRDPDNYYTSAVRGVIPEYNGSSYDSRDSYSSSRSSGRRAPEGNYYYEYR